MDLLIARRHLAIAVFINNKIFISHFGCHTDFVISLHIGKEPVLENRIFGAGRYRGPSRQLNAPQIKIKIKRSPFGIVVSEVKHAGNSRSKKKNCD